MPGQMQEADFELLLTPEQREKWREEKARRSEFWRTPPDGSNADEWLLYISENGGSLPKIAVAIAEAIEAAQGRIWSEFVMACEALENDAEASAEKLPAGENVARHFYRGQEWTAKQIRRYVEHPKYRRN